LALHTSTVVAHLLGYISFCESYRCSPKAIWLSIDVQPSGSQAGITLRPYHLRILDMLPAHDMVPWSLQRSWDSLP
jgi:hypothetical protein